MPSSGECIVSATSQVFASHQQVFANRQNDLEGAVSRYSPMLFRVALRRLRNVEDAEDAVQDALLSACKYIGQFEGRSQLSTWLTRIVVNAAGMKLRRHARHETVSLDENREGEGAILANQMVDGRPNPESICAQTEMNETLRMALAQLPPKLRSAFQLREIAGLTTQEAADALGISTTSLKSRLMRARASLHLLLGQLIEAPGTTPLDEEGTGIARRRRAA
jgi:RNA polymerase sigma-70 factor, ECF subfamily